MRLRDSDLIKVLRRIDEDIVDWDTMVAMEEIYEIWSWHPGMG